MSAYKLGVMFGLIMGDAPWPVAVGALVLLSLLIYGLGQPVMAFSDALTGWLRR